MHLLDAIVHFFSFCLLGCRPPDVCCGALYARHGINVPRTSMQRYYELLHAELKPLMTETNKFNRLSHVYKQIAEFWYENLTFLFFFFFFFLEFLN